MPFDDDDDERRCEAAFLALRDAVVADGVARRVRSAEDGRFFVAAGIASVVEHRFDERLDPETLSGDALEHWMQRATAEGETWSDPRGRRGALLLLLDSRLGPTASARRIGTLEVEWLSISRYAWITNLYVVPDARGRGIASGLLDRVHDALAPAGALGLSLSTHWAWQPAVAFYLRHGATVRAWTPALSFVWRRPGESWSIAIEGDDARFRFRAEDGRELVGRAAREGGWLRWEPPPPERGVLDADRDRAARTFAVALAMRGWPLARSPEALARAVASDADTGAPEELAAKIEQWEAWDRKHGFSVPTPRIPHLASRAYETLAGD